MKAEKRLVGRPRSAPKEGQKATLGIRASADLKNRLDAAAKNAGRSLSQEAEFRLEQSFQRQDLLAPALELAYGREMAGVLLVLARALASNGRIGALIKTGSPDAMQNWHRDPDAFDEATKAANEVLETFRPPGDPTNLLADRAKRNVRIMLDAIKNPEWGEQFAPAAKNPELERFASGARDMLGPELLAMIPDAGEDQ